MITGYVVNNTGRYMHIFKRGVFPGMSISLEDLYCTYEHVYDGDLSIGFVKWLDENKVPDGFDIVVEKYEETESNPNKNISVLEDKNKDTKNLSMVAPTRITSKQIADLKIKDDPKKIISNVDSISKLRRALSLCKKRKGKGTLEKYIRARISELS